MTPNNPHRLAVPESLISINTPRMECPARSPASEAVAAAVVATADPTSFLPGFPRPPRRAAYAFMMGRNDRPAPQVTVDEDDDDDLEAGRGAEVRDRDLLDLDQSLALDVAEGEEGEEDPSPPPPVYTPDPYAPTPEGYTCIDHRREMHDSPPRYSPYLAPKDARVQCADVRVCGVRLITVVSVCVVLITAAVIAAGVVGYTNSQKACSTMVEC